MTSGQTQTHETIHRAMVQMPLPELRSIVKEANEQVWTKVALEVARQVLEQRGLEGGDSRAVNCPMCGASTHAGMVRVQATCLSFLVVGLSWVHCWFEPFQGERERIIRCEGQRRGHRCEECGAVVIEGATWN
ncbi:MAG: hypothetical protein V2A76_15150 [Planctomycetota bacterium]